jgi:hypothetical protein
MRVIPDVLRETELKFQIARREVEALRVVAPLLSDESDQSDQNCLEGCLHGLAG